MFYGINGVTKAIPFVYGKTVFYPENDLRLPYLSTYVEKVLRYNSCNSSENNLHRRCSITKAISLGVTFLKMTYVCFTLSKW